MTERQDQFRQNAADCVKMAQESPSPNARAFLLDMAEKWRALANGPKRSLNGILHDYNERQMIAPVQQQQQIQGKRKA
jgi:hypothetical protein